MRQRIINWSTTWKQNHLDQGVEITQRLGEMKPKDMPVKVSADQLHTHYVLPITFKIFCRIPNRVMSSGR